MAQENDTGIPAAGGSRRENHRGIFSLKAKTEPLQTAPCQNRAQSFGTRMVQNSPILPEELQEEKLTWVLYTFLES